MSHATIAVRRRNDTSPPNAIGSKNTATAPSGDQLDTKSHPSTGDGGQGRLIAALAHYGTTMRRSHLCGEAKIGRSTSYTLEDPGHPNFNPAMPVGFKLSSSPNAPTLWWTIEIMAWLERRAITVRKR